ncbi:hypothetical protein LFML04_2201 [Leptospirillum ferriphilum ML-04]|uniref:Uncharacterized protein n=1 Tax=Leptospirillum ferriphilum (strain ML-04) TaxID=1048260 RepID=J9ZES3_LEPFM|nr:hypothetical protein LFML04_2201 [Leptospirillum ferriphilum ML-04]
MVAGRSDTHSLHHEGRPSSLRLRKIQEHVGNDGTHFAEGFGFFQEWVEKSSLACSSA